MKIQKKDLKVVLYLVGILALVCGYFLGYQSLATKRTELEAQRTLLQEKEARVNEIYENQTTYQIEAEEAEQEVDEILAKYPAGVKAEDTILYASELETGFDATVSTISLTEGNVIYSLGSGTSSETEDTSSDDTEDTEDAETAEDATQTAASTIADDIGIIDASTVSLPQITLLDTEVIYDFTATYEDSKSMIESILAFAEKRNVTSIALSYDEESGMLVGNMNVNMYYLSGTDAEYSEPDTGVTTHGTDNIFATLKKGDKNDEKKEDDE